MREKKWIDSRRFIFLLILVLALFSIQRFDRDRSGQNHIAETSAETSRSPRSLRRSIEMEGFRHQTDVKRKLAMNPHTPINVLDELSGDESDYLVRDVGMNPAVTAEILARIANSTKSYIRLWGVARNPKTPLESLWQMANRTLPDFDPRGLSHDIWDLYQRDIFTGLAENKNSPPELLAKLAAATDEYNNAGLALIRNAKTPCESLAKFIDQNPYNPYVASVAKTHIAKRCMTPKQ